MNTEFWKTMRLALPCLAWTLASAVSAQAASNPLVTNQPSQWAAPDVSITPVATYANVRGDQEKFREDVWMKQGWTGGVDEFSLHQKLGKDASLNFEGRGIFDQHDYKLRLEIVKPEVGFVRAGFTQYRKYFDDLGGFYRPFGQKAFDPEKNLGLDIGDIFVDVGLTMPNLPKVTLGYERQYKHGTESLLEWGSVQETLAPAPPAQPTGTVTKKIYPSLKAVDETVDIFKADIEYDIKNLHLGDDFRYEYDRESTRRLDDLELIEPASSPSKTATTKENYHHDDFSNVFRMESWLNEKTFWSLGYMFSSLKGRDGLNLDTVPSISPFDVNVVTKMIDLQQDSHVLNLGVLVGPYAGLIGYGGVQAETMDTDGNGDGELTSPGGASEVKIQTANDRDSLEENIGLRFTKIPFTTLYVEGKWTEQQIDLTENEIAAGSVPPVAGAFPFRLKTETDVFRQDYTIGMNSSPLRNVTVSGQYRHSIDDNSYEHQVDTISGYPGFINDQKLTTDEVSTKLTLRPASQLSVSFRYQLVATDIDTDSEPVPLLGIPGGRVHSGNYDANIYSASFTVTPDPRMYLTGLFSYQDTRTIAYDHGANSVIEYRGNVYCVVGTMGYAIDNKTDLTVEYTYSRADDFQNNGSSANPKAGFTSTDFGLPLGVDNERHAATITLARKFTEHVVGRLRYGFYEFRDPGMGGADNYQAHLASASCTIHF